MSSVIKNKLAFTIKLIKKDEFKFIWKAFLRRIHSEETAFGFKRDLNIELSKPSVLIDITTRVFKESDDVFFIDNANDGLIAQFKTCYVATTKEDHPCSRLWLIDAFQNKKLKKVWGDNFPQLNKDEVLLENVFTIPKFRGMGIMPSFMDQIAKKSKNQGANYAITFGAVNNTNTSRSFKYAGFNPYILRKVKWLLFRKTITFEEIPNDVMEFYNKVTLRIPNRY